MSVTSGLSGPSSARTRGTGVYCIKLPKPAKRSNYPSRLLEPMNTSTQKVHYADGWLKTFNDSGHDALGAETLREQNPNLRVLAEQIDRAEAAVQLALGGSFEVEPST